MGCEQRFVPRKPDVWGTRSDMTVTFLWGLCADVAGVEAAGDGGIGSAFEDGAAVGEDGHFVGGDAEAEEEVVVADLGDGAGEALL